MLVADILETMAVREPNRPAAWFKGEWKTYGELWKQAASVAAFLRAVGVQPGDRVAILLENSFDYIASHFGVLKAGAVDVSLNTELKAEGLRTLLLDCNAKVLIAGTKFIQEWKDIVTQLPDLNQVIIDRKPEQPLLRTSKVEVHLLPEIFTGPAVDGLASGRIDLDLASIVYTSGVTGRPKGVMLSHLNLVSNTRSIVRYLGLQPDDRMMVVLPFYYIYGRSLLYSHFLSGGSLIIDNRFAFPVMVLNTMQEQAATCFAGVPSTYSILLNKTDVRTRRFQNLRFLTQAGGGMAPTLQREVVKVFDPARLFVMYGTTEAAPRLSYVEPEILPRKWGSIGKAIPNVDVIVVDEDGKQLSPNRIGEIAARGSNIMMGYWKDPEGTAKVIRHGYYFTGDLGYADEEGYLFLVGRSGDMIKTGGNRVSAKEIEDMITAVPGVLETAVVAVPDEILGEAIKAYVVLDSSTLDGRGSAARTGTPASAVSNCRSRLSFGRVYRKTKAVRC